MKNLVKFIVFIIVFCGLLALVSPKQDLSGEIASVKDAENSLKPETNGCIVLNYHLIRDDSFINKLYHELFGYNFSKQYNVSKQEFAKQMQFLSDNDIDVLSSSELQKHMDNDTVPDACVNITFDDIDTSVYDNAYPILQKYNYPFTVFIITNKMPANEGLIQETPERIKEMKSSGLASVGLHTDSMHLPDPNTGLPSFLDPRTHDQFDLDTKTSIKKYEQVLGEKPKYFAYPHGFGTDDTDKVILDNGFEQIFTLGNGTVTNDTTDEYIPRVLVTESNFKVVADWLLKYKK